MKIRQEVVNIWIFIFLARTKQFYWLKIKKSVGVDETHLNAFTVWNSELRASQYKIISYQSNIVFWTLQKYFGIACLFIAGCWVLHGQNSLVFTFGFPQVCIPMPTILVQFKVPLIAQKCQAIPSQNLFASGSGPMCEAQGSRVAAAFDCCFVPELFGLSPAWTLYSNYKDVWR